MLSVEDLARLVDKYVKTREQRLDIERSAEALKEIESETKAQLMEALQESKAGGVAGATHRVTLRKKAVPSVTNWQELYAYIAANDAWDMLQRRLSPPAVKERWDDGKEVPGVGTIEVTDLSVNKL